MIPCARFGGPLTISRRSEPAGIASVSTPGARAVSTLGSRAVSSPVAHGPSVPPAHGPSVPQRAIRISSPMAHGPSVPHAIRVSTPGPQAVSPPHWPQQARLVAERTATVAHPSHRPQAERAVDRAAPKPRIAVRVALLSTKPLTRSACPIQPDVGRLHCRRQERLVRRPPPRPVPADPIPTQARAFATGGYEHWLARVRSSHSTVGSKCRRA